MRSSIQLVLVALIAGAITLGGYKYFFENQENSLIKEEETNLRVFPTNYSESTGFNAPDLTLAAESTVNAVVHVKNTAIVSSQPRNIFEFFYGGGQPRAQIGTGSGVIISPDGYIITNNHVIENAKELEITLNNNEIYEAELVGTDPKTDIALLKINGTNNFPYIPFGDSDKVRLGEWVLAVGNPFNLKSTVTVGIISAKARNLNDFDNTPSSFIQTDAAVNRGNSGGALVDVQGNLIGINTAITSETGSYVGYSFAVPSNIARKVIEDLLEYGNVQRALLGIKGIELNSKIAEDLKIKTSQGIYVNEVEEASGAAEADLKNGDIISEIDGIRILKFSDLTGHISSKRPDDVVSLKLIRNGKELRKDVRLLKIERYAIPELGLEINEATQNQLRKAKLTNGVVISRVLSPEMQAYNLEGAIITHINDKLIRNVEQVKNIMDNKSPRENISLKFQSKSGETHTFIFR